MRKYVLALLILTLSFCAYGQEISILNPAEGNILQGNENGPSMVIVQWSMNNIAPGTNASFSLDGKPSIIRDQIDPIILYVDNGPHTITANLIGADGVLATTQSQAVRSFTVGTNAQAIPSSAQIQIPGQAPSQSMPNLGQTEPSSQSIPVQDPTPALFTIPAQAFPTQQSPSDQPPIPIPSYQPLFPPSEPSLPIQQPIITPPEEEATGWKAIPAKALSVASELPDTISQSSSTSKIIALVLAVSMLGIGAVLLVQRGRMIPQAPGGVDENTFNAVVGYVKQYQMYYPNDLINTELLKSGYNQETINAALADARKAFAPIQPK